MVKTKEEKKEYQRQWYEKNKERVKKWNKEYHIKNRKKRCEYSRKYYQENKEKKAKYDKQYAKKNRDKKIKYHREWSKNNKDKIKQYYKKRAKRVVETGQGAAKCLVYYYVSNGYLKNLKEEYVKCAYCDKRAIHYDHRDYNKPLVVQPVCQSCNIKLGPAKPKLTNRQIAKGDSHAKTKNHNTNRSC